MNEDPLVDPAAPAAESAPTPDPKDQNREGYAQRQLEKQLKELRAENEAYKRRDEEARKAKLSEQQQIAEELAQLKAERDQIHQENLRRKVASEYGLPESLIGRLIGSDENALRADAEELAALLPKKTAGTHTNPTHVHSTPKIYTRAELAADPILARSPEVLKAAKEGRVK
jgi:hypothetical protein